MSPAELEELLLTHPEISDVAVVGVPCDRSGEIPKAYVVLKANSSTTEEDICHFVQGIYAFVLFVVRNQHRWQAGASFQSFLSS